VREQAERLRVRRQLPHARHNTEMLLNAGGFHSIISHFGPIIFMLAHLVGGRRGNREARTGIVSWRAACYVNDRQCAPTSGVKSGRRAANKSAPVNGLQVAWRAGLRGPGRDARRTAAKERARVACFRLVSRRGKKSFPIFPMPLIYPSWMRRARACVQVWAIGKIQGGGSGRMRSKLMGGEGRWNVRQVLAIRYCCPALSGCFISCSVQSVSPGTGTTNASH
jgi:hypothetical protein